MNITQKQITTALLATLSTFFACYLLGYFAVFEQNQYKALNITIMLIGLFGFYYQCAWVAYRRKEKVIYPYIGLWAFVTSGLMFIGLTGQAAAKLINPLVAITNTSIIGFVIGCLTALLFLIVNVNTKNV